MDAAMDFRAEKRPGSVITSPPAKKARVEPIPAPAVQPNSLNGPTIKTLQTKVETLADRFQINKKLLDDTEVKLAIAVAEINLLKIREKTNTNIITLLSERVSGLENMIASITALMIAPQSGETVSEPTTPTDTPKSDKCWPVVFGHEPDELFDVCVDISFSEAYQQQLIEEDIVLAFDNDDL